MRKITDQERCVLACVGILLLGLESVRLETRAGWQKPGEDRGRLSALAEQASDRASRNYDMLCKAMGSEEKLSL